MMISPQS